MDCTRKPPSTRDRVRRLARGGWLAIWLGLACVLAWPAFRPAESPEQLASLTAGCGGSLQSDYAEPDGDDIAPTKNIEEIEVGDVVLARDDATGEVALKRVVRIFRNTVDHLRILSIRNADGAIQEIKTTNEHPFFVPERGWVVAGELTPGTNLLQADEQLGVVVATRVEEHPEGTPVFNFEVEDYHTYYVADQPTRGPPRYVLTHNKCDPKHITYTPDVAGRIVLAEAKVTKKLLHEGSRVSAAARKQIDELMDGDDAGHIIAKVLGGSGDDAANLFGMVAKKNRGQMAALERKIAGEMRKAGGKVVEVKVELKYLDDLSKRVKEIEYSYKLPGGKWIPETIKNSL